MRVLSAAIIGVLGLVAAGSIAAAQAPPALDPQKVAAGLKLYDTLKCASCHSIAGKGATRSPLDGVGAKLSVADIRAWIVTPADMEAKMKPPPRVKMSAMMRTKKLTDADVGAVVAYMQSLR